MNSHVLRFAFFAFLFAFATSAHAQATGADCSTANQPTKSWNEQPYELRPRLRVEQRLRYDALRRESSRSVFLARSILRFKRGPAILQSLRAVDGIATSCGIIQSIIGAGAAVQCPNNICSGISDNGQFVQFQAFADGSSGYP